MPVLRKNWGILIEPSPAEEAEAVAEALTKAGCAAVAVPISLLDNPPAPELTAKAELAGDGFDVVSAAGGERMSWSRLKVISAGAVSRSDLKSVTEGPSLAEKSVRLGLTMATGLPLMSGKSKTRQVVRERRESFIELIFVEPARRVRIMAGNFAFTALGEKMSYSAELNFRALVSELAARAPAALRGKGARGVLAKAPSGELAYESFEEVEREERWLLALAVLAAALP